MNEGNGKNGGLNGNGQSSATTESRPDLDAWKLHRLAIVDVETTGFDPELDLVLEVGLIVTDGDLNVIAGEDVIVRWTKKQLDLAIDRPDRDPKINAYIRDMHTKNGLLPLCSSSTSSIGVAR